jgi:hypothetical protein
MAVEIRLKIQSNKNKSGQLKEKNISACKMELRIRRQGCAKSNKKGFSRLAEGNRKCKNLKLHKTLLLNLHGKPYSI